jgi:hypothetical protein
MSGRAQLHDDDGYGSGGERDQTAGAPSAKPTGDVKVTDKIKAELGIAAAKSKVVAKKAVVAVEKGIGKMKTFFKNKRNGTSHQQMDGEGTEEQ